MAAEAQRPTDEELARDARAGREAAFEALVCRYENPVFLFLRARTGNVHDAEDLTQQTFVKVYRSLNRYDAKYRFKPWLYTIAGRLAVSHYRVRTAVPVEPGALDAVDPRTPDLDLSASEAAGRLWDWARLRLKPGEFTALWLRFQEDLSVAEIATTMQKTHGHVKVLLFRGRRRLLAAHRRAGDTDAVDEVVAPPASSLVAGFAQGGEVR